MFDGLCRADSVATRAKYDAMGWVFDYGSHVSFFLFKLECSQLAVIYAFSAAEAFIVVYHRVPWDLVSGDSVPSFFGQFEAS